MADLTDLLHLAGQVRRPALVELERVAERRGRRTAVTVTAAVAFTAVAILLALQPAWYRGAAPVPGTPWPTSLIHSPAPSSVGGFPRLSPEEIRRHPAATSQRVDDWGQVPRGVGARIWTVCLGGCSRATPVDPGGRQQVLEVSRDGFKTGALYPLEGSANIGPAVDDWFFVDGSQGSILVDSRGRERSLTHGDPAAVTDIEGPLVPSMSGLAYVDLKARSLHVIEGGGWDWDSAEDSWFWGAVYRVPNTSVLEQALVWQNADGSFSIRLLPIGVTSWSTQMLRSGTPGTMGAIDPGPPRLLHVTTDYGATWDVRVLPPSWGGGTDVPKDWRSWTEAWRSWPRP